MANKAATSRSTFKQDFFRFVTERVAVAGKVMPGCDIKEYESLSVKYSRLYEEICGKLGERGKKLLGEFDFISEILAAFDADNSYIQGFADGMIFMGLFKKV